jgi:predicted nucleotidyltransferase component of viral defense system
VIPRANITAWRDRAPWPTSEQVEQDLVLSRALVAVFSDPDVAARVVLRGGTALHKLFLDAPVRYSEDIDLVQRDARPIGPLIAGIRGTLDEWLGSPKWRQGRDGFTLYYFFETSSTPAEKRRVKIEINTREHFAVLGVAERAYTIENPWFAGSATVPVYHLDELLGTKMRALYQRKKGRDLFDLGHALRSVNVDRNRIVECFGRYVEFQGLAVSRAEFEANLAAKLEDEAFIGDVLPLIPAEVDYDPHQAAFLVREGLIARLPEGSGRALR